MKFVATNNFAILLDSTISSNQLVNYQLQHTSNLEFLQSYMKQGVTKTERQSTLFFQIYSF